MLDIQPKPLDPRSLAIHDRALACARKFLVAEAELLTAIMEVDRRRIFEKFGHSALTTYCVHNLKLSEEVAGCFVRVARKSKEVPELKVALEQRKLTLFKAKAIASVINKENQQEWIEKAASLSKEKLEHEVARASGKGSLQLKLFLSAEDRELLKQARDLVSRAKGRDASWEETIMDALKLWLDRHDPLRRAERNQTKSHDNRPRGRSATLRLSAHIKHAVNRRDRGRCQARLPDGSACGNTRWIHLHHVVPRSQGGEDSPENLITLCSAHHQQWHEAH